MGDRATFETLVSAAVFVIPIAALLTLVILLSLRRRRAARPPAVLSETPTGPLHAFQTPDAQPQVPLSVEDVETIIAKIEAALARGEKTSLSGLYCELAAGHARAGKVDERMAALRSAAGYGALHGPPAAHAAARLALGEAAHLAGDLTTACEQWQMARTAYLQAGETEHHARIENRMRENGCPTDWVLTDF